MKRIKLTQGQFAIVDDADYDWLNQWKWCANKMGENFYAIRMSPMKAGKRFVISMARQILGLEHKDKQLSDHINHITLDNRRANLRICTYSQNAMNRKLRSDTSSKYKGVFWYRRYKKWKVQIRIGRAIKHIGFFISEKEAALAYNKAAKKHYGKFAYLNPAEELK